MKKGILCFCLGLCLLGQSVMAIEFDAVVPFSGESNPAGKFYFPLSSNYDLVFGISSEVPATMTRELDVDLILGVNSKMPLLGYVDMYFTFDNHSGGAIEGGYVGSEFYTKSFSVSKRWMFSLTESVDIGISAELGRIMLDGSRIAYGLQHISPVIGATISIF